jgi:Flp pilus assembly protein TadD
MRHIPSAAMLASLKVGAGDLDGARSIAQELRERFPTESIPYVLEAEILVLGDSPVEASRAYGKALSIANTQRHAIRAYQIRNQAGLDNQIESLVNYLAERPLDSSMRIYLAQAYQRLDQPGKANAEYERVLKDEPDNFVAANNLAWNYFTSGDSRAEGVARRAYELQPNNGSVADTLGWILVKAGSLEEGVTTLRKATDLSEGRPDVRYHLAAGLVATGQTDEAAIILREILDSDIEFSNRRDAENLLNTL